MTNAKSGHRVSIGMPVFCTVFVTLYEIDRTNLEIYKTIKLMESGGRSL